MSDFIISYCRSPLTVLIYKLHSHRHVFIERHSTCRVQGYRGSWVTGARPRHAFRGTLRLSPLGSPLSTRAGPASSAALRPGCTGHSCSHSPTSSPPAFRPEGPWFALFDTEDLNLRAQDTVPACSRESPTRVGSLSPNQALSHRLLH